MNLKQAIDLIVSSIYNEEAARSVNKPLNKVLKIGNEFKRVDVNLLIKEHLKEANKLIQEHYCKGNGNKIVEMSYELIDIFKSISYLSEEDRNKVKTYLKTTKHA